MPVPPLPANPRRPGLTAAEADQVVGAVTQVPVAASNTWPSAQALAEVLCFGSLQ
jgi:hypothetical protein